MNYDGQLDAIYWVAMEDSCEAWQASQDFLTHPADKPDFAADARYHLTVARVAQEGADLIKRAFS